MSSLDKALSILSCYSLESSELGVTEVADRLGMPKSSTSRLMKAMAEAGLLEQRPDRTYVPGLLAFQLGNIYQRRLRILTLVDEAVGGLVKKFGLTGYVGVMNGQEVILIGVQQGSYPVRLVLEKGTRIPAQVSGIGMALLSRHSEAKIQKLFPETIRYEETSRVSSTEDIIAQARKVREAGFVTMTGGTYYGFSAIAAAVESTAERQLIGFSLSCPDELLNEVDIREIEQAVASTAYEIGVRTADSYWLTRKPAKLGLKGGQDGKIEEEAGIKSKNSAGRLAGGL